MQYACWSLFFSFGLFVFIESLRENQSSPLGFGSERWDSGAKQTFTGGSHIKYWPRNSHDSKIKFD